MVWTLPLLPVAAMLVVAAATDQPEVIFPEGAALTFGIWAMQRPDWTSSRWRILVLPPLTAIVGVLLARVSIPVWVGQLAVLTVGLVVLQALRSRLAPTLAAGMFPLVFGIDEWVYPLSVLAICACIAAGMPRLAVRVAVGTVADRLERWPGRTVAGFWLLSVAWMLVAGRLLALPSAALAPPLFVSTLDWVTGGGAPPPDGLRRWGLLVGAAVLGTGAEDLLATGPASGILALIATLLLARALRAPHPPALAIALVPQIVQGTSTPAFVAAVA
ncbi:MAG: hypothetical protein M3296_05000, partial [Actinomycetota bacterium]|nr:hypothetical protein [Actinomycetota bacterium]